MIKETTKPDDLLEFKRRFFITGESGIHNAFNQLPAFYSESDLFPEKHVVSRTISSVSSSEWNAEILYKTLTPLNLEKGDEL